MKLRHLGALAVLCLGFAGQASAETVLKASVYSPPTQALAVMLEDWSAELKEKSGGELRLQVYPSAQLGPPPHQYDLVTSGVADIAVVLHGFTPGRFPMTELAGLPLTHPSAGDASAVASRRLTELSPTYLASEHPGTKILWMAVTPALKLHFKSTSPEPIGNIAGLRIRYAGKSWQDIITALGASPVPVPPIETTDAMSKGIIDGAAFPFEAAKTVDLGSIAKYSLEPGLASATFAVVMNEEVYKGLSPELRKLIDETTGPDRAAATGRLLDENESEARQYMLDAGVKIVTLDDARLSELKARLQPITAAAIDALTGKGLPAKAFVDDYAK